jgi:all-trans-8'-apo-beta-carotenal 15,15'-oxygenase
LWKALLQIGSFSDWVAWEPSLGAEVVVVPLDDPNKARRKAIDPFWVWHFSNAFERGDEIVVDLSRYADLGSLTALGGGAGGAPPSMWRARIDLRSFAFSMEQLGDAQAEFPRVHPARSGVAYRDCWILGKRANEGEGIARLDVESGRFEWWTPGDGDVPSEPVVVPRAGSSERDAWVLCLVDSAAKERSYVAILDAKAPQDGPVARVWFDSLLPRTFHGTWA